MLTMRMSPASVAAELGVDSGEPSRVLARLGDPEARRRAAEGWADLDPEAAVRAVVPGLDEAAWQATARLVDREIVIMPAADGPGARIQARGADGLRALARLPAEVLGGTRELFVERLGPEAAPAFAEVAVPSRFPALASLEVAGQAAAADAALALVDAGVVDFTYRARGFGSAHARRLASHPLRRVALMSLDAEVALPLLSLESLETLELTCCPLAHKHLKLLLELPALAKLTLANQGMPKSATKVLAELESLVSLDASKNATVDDASWARLASLGRLRRLVLDGNHVGPRTLAALAPLPISELHLVNTKLTACAPLASLRQLEVLRLDRADPDAAGFAALGRLPALRELSLAGVRARERLQHLTGLPRLRYLGLAGCGLRTEDVAPLAQILSLRRLDLQGNPALAGTGAQPLEGLSLTALDLSRCKTGNRALPSLARIPSLEWLAVSDDGIDDAAPLARLGGLRWLHLGNNPLGAASAAVGELRALVELYVEGCRLDDAFGKVAARLGALRRLFAWENAIGDGAVAELATMKQLRVGNLVGNPLGPAARQRLAEALPDCRFEW